MRRTALRQAEKETDEADRIESALCLVAAGDFRPAAPEYHMAPAPRLIDFTMAAFRRTDFNREVQVPVGAIGYPLGRVPGQVVVELNRLPAGLMDRYRAMGLLHRGYTGRMVRLLHARVTGDGRSREKVVDLCDQPTSPGQRDDGFVRWYPLTRFGLVPWDEESVLDGPNMAIVASTLSRDYWTVAYASEGTPAVRVMTCEDGVKGLFTMRDKPDGMTRRQALRHWVRHHNRRTPSGRDVDVSRHLRGAVEFEWFGLRCRIHPPEAK